MIYRYLLIALMICKTIFALDATMQIIKNKSTLPTIDVVISTDTKVPKNLDKGILSLIKKDLQVSGHFKSSSVSIDTDYEETPKYKILQENGIDLYLVLQIIPNGKGLIVSSRLYDVNTNTLVLDKTYATIIAVRYPFLSN